MTVRELVECLRLCADEDGNCMVCKWFGKRCGDWGCVAELMVLAADALESRNAGDELAPAWIPVKFGLPSMETIVIEDIEDEIEYQRSQEVLGYTVTGQIVVVVAYLEDGKLWWCDIDGEDYEVTHWMPIKKKERKNVLCE